MYSKGVFSGSLTLGSVKLKITPFPNKTTILRVCSTSLSKTLREKEKFARNERFFLFPTEFSALSENVLPFSSANSLCLEESKICRLEKV